MTETTNKIGHNAHPRGLRRWRHPGMKQTFQELGDGTVRVLSLIHISEPTRPY